MITLSFTGDLLVYRSLIKKSLSNGRYNFDDVFINVKDLFRNSTYVVGNLETPIAGKHFGYTRMDMLFNTPKEFAESMVNAGFNMVTTANNHCTDKGILGVNETLKNLTSIGLEHTGIREDLHSKNYIIKDFDSVKIAFISYTYGTNPNVNGCLLSEDDELRINITKKPDCIYHRSWLKQIVMDLFFELPKSLQDRIHPLYPQHPYDDNVSKTEIESEENNIYIERLKETIQKVKLESDLIVFCLHAGGQFNNEVGPYTQYLINLIKDCGADIIICNHPHCVLGSEWNKNSFVAYSLGNFTFTPGEGYFIDGVYGEYGVVLHIDIEELKIKDVRFSIVKNIKTKDGKTQVQSTSLLYLNAGSDSEKQKLYNDIIAVIERFIKKPVKNIIIKETYSYTEF